MTSRSTIGIDPALTNIGMVCLVRGASFNSFGSDLVQPKNLRDLARLSYIQDQVKHFIQERNAELVVLEGYDYKGHNLAQLGEASGVIKLICHQLGLPVLVVSPASVKKFSTGNSNASKELVMARYGLSNEHVADARALAEIGLVYLTGVSQFRHELEVIKQLKTTKVKKPVMKRNLAKLPVAI